MQRTNGILVGLSVLVLGLSACNEQSAGPTASDYQRQRAEILDKHKANSRAVAVADPAAASGKPGTEGSGAMLGDIGSFFYDAVGKRDPFRSFIQDNKSLEAGIDSPLVKFDLGQLEVAGVVWSVDSDQRAVGVTDVVVDRRIAGDFNGNASADKKSDTRSTVEGDTFR